MQFSVDQISDIIGLAKEAGGALKVGLDIQDRLKKVFSGEQPVGDHEAERLVTDLLREIKEAHLANIALQAQLAVLHQAALGAQRQEAEFSRYELWKTPFGTLIYRLKQEYCDAGEAQHYICPNCKEEDRKSILQGQDHWVECPKCKQGYRITPNEPVDWTAHGRRNNRWDGF